MSFTRVKLADGSEYVIRIHHSVVEEAANNEELIPTIDRSRLIPMVDVVWWSAETVRSD